MTGLLSSENWIAELPPPVRGEIMSAMTTRSLEPGECLKAAGDLPDACYQVQSGFIKLMGLHPDGRPMLIGLYRSGNTFAETSIVARRNGHKHTTIALVPTSVLRLAREDFWSLYRAHPEIPEALCRKFARTITSLFQTREQAASYRLRERILIVLENLARYCGEQEPSGKISFSLPLSNTDIAQHLDATRQAVQREMTALQSAGAVTRRGGRWYLALPASHQLQATLY